ncbi:MAG: hypothetical protein JRG91_04600 [Deltaproteobacteria bacterium]|nr:hypothetical protein [Deltaproteobacteria bacterium]
MKTLACAITMVLLVALPAQAQDEKKKSKKVEIKVTAVADGVTDDVVEEVAPVPEAAPVPEPPPPPPDDDIITMDWKDFKKGDHEWGGKGNHHTGHRPSGDEAIVMFGQSKTIEPGEKVGGDVVIFGGSIDIGEGAIIDGDVVCMGGSVSMGPGVRVEGDVVTLGGNLEIGPGVTVDGDAVNMGGTLTIGPEAAIDGDAVNMGGGLEIDPTAEVSGDKVRVIGGPNFPIPFEKLSKMFGHFEMDAEDIDKASGFIDRLVDVVKDIILFAFILFMALLMTVFMPKQLGRIDDHLTGSFPRSALLGLGAFILLPLALIILAVTIIGIPLIPLLLLAVIVSSLMGYLTFSRVLGRRLVGGRHVMIQILVGMALFQGTIILGNVIALPGGAMETIGHTVRFLGQIALLGVHFIGLGAVLYSRWGKRTIEQTRKAQAPNGNGNENGNGHASGNDDSNPPPLTP